RLVRQSGSQTPAGPSIMTALEMNFGQAFLGFLGQGAGQVTQANQLVPGLPRLGKKAVFLEFAPLCRQMLHQIERPAHGCLLAVAVQLVSASWSITNGVIHAR